MKAWTLFHKGMEHLTIEADFPIPLIKGEYDILVKVLVAGLNSFDLIKSTSDFESPVILGCDACGIVTEVGTKVVHSDISPGSLVYFVNPQGTFSDFVVQDARAVAVIPAQLFEDKDINKLAIQFGGLAASALTAYYDMVVKGGLTVFPTNHISSPKIHKNIFITRPTDDVGSLCLQLASRYRALLPDEVRNQVRIIVYEMPENAKIATQLGATHVVSCKREELYDEVKHVTRGEMIDLFIDNLSDLDRGLECLNFSGAYVSNWNINKEIDIKHLWEKQSSIHFVDILANYESRSHFQFLEHKIILQNIVRLVAEGKLKQIQRDTIDFKDIKETLLDTKTKRHLSEYVAVINRYNHETPEALNPQMIYVLLL